MAALQRDTFNPRAAIIPLALMVIFWGIAAFRFAQGDIWTPLLLAYIGVYVGAGVGLFVSLPQKRRSAARKIMMLMMGSLLLVIALTSDHGNMQIEGLFFAVLMGAGYYIVLHYALAKIVGPAVFGRVWCGWACWFGMIFDLLPYPYSRYRVPGKWTYWRYVHLLAVLALTLGLVVLFQYSGGVLGVSGMTWFVAGLAFYYTLGVYLALKHKDNRAFCKYACPIAALQKIPAKYSLLKISGDPTHCENCFACTEMCPMNIRVRDYVMMNERVLSTECTLCQTCINICPHDSLKLSFGLDVGGKELIDYEPPTRAYKRRGWF